RLRTHRRRRGGVRRRWQGRRRSNSRLQQSRRVEPGFGRGRWRWWPRRGWWWRRPGRRWRRRSPVGLNATADERRTIEGVEHVSYQRTNQVMAVSGRSDYRSRDLGDAAGVCGRQGRARASEEAGGGETEDLRQRRRSREGPHNRGKGGRYEDGAGDTRSRSEGPRVLGGRGGRQGKPRAFPEGLR